MAKVSFFTGKGGVGKSTLAAAYAKALAIKTQKPVLVIDANGSGQVLNLLRRTQSMSSVPQETTCLDSKHSLWGVLIRPKACFKEYFAQNIPIGEGIFSSAAKTLKEKIVDSVVNNKIVSAFVDVCPGLEPAVLIGKIFFEANQGKCPETDTPWGHIVVDAPATGHGILMFKSLFALNDIFKIGPIANTSQKLRDYFLNPSHLSIKIVSLLNEHAVKEAQHIVSVTKEMGFHNFQIFANRVLPDFRKPSELEKDSIWKNSVEALKQDSIDQAFHLKILGDSTGLIPIPILDDLSVEDIANVFAENRVTE